MSNGAPNETAASKATLTGHDFAVMLCRITAIWMLYASVHFALAVLPVLPVLFRPSISAGDPLESWFWDGLIYSAQAWLGLIIFSVVGILLWRRADGIARRMLGDASIRVMDIGVSGAVLMRIALITTGIWYSIPNLVYLCLIVFKIVWNKLSPPETTESPFQTVPEDTFAIDTAAAFESFVFLILGGILILGSGNILSMLRRIKNVGLDD